jgi:hypothetical protein
MQGNWGFWCGGTRLTVFPPCTTKEGNVRSRLTVRRSGSESDVWGSEFCILYSVFCILVPVPSASLW